MKVLYVFAAVIWTVLSKESPALKELTEGNLAFSAKTYKELAKDNTKNFLVCPLSVAVVLALTEAGAGGQTATQIISGLNLPSTKNKIHKAFKGIASSMNVDDTYKLLSANKVFIKNGYGVNPKFKKIATDVFKADIEELDFDDGSAATRINKWASKKTREKINNVVNDDDFDDRTRAVLVNALYFYGLWTNPFEKENTKEKTFHVSSKNEAKVQMMEQTDWFNFFRDETLKAKFLEMDYADSPIRTTIVLPDDIDGISNLEENIEKVLERPRFSDSNVHVQIPKIKLENTIDFIPILKQLGIKDLFDHNANLTGITGVKEHLEISKIVQKTFIEVEEQGTTAAAVTADIGVSGSAMMDDNVPVMEFEANHPFIFIISFPEGILFVGRYVIP